MTTAIEVRTGYVAFFDILGYREMTSHKNFRAVIRVLQDAKADAEQLILNGKKNYDLFTFGDSMIVFCAGETEDSTAESAARLPVYLRALFRRMFKRGMPVRGAIAKGAFYFKDQTYAGQPLNEAYEYANSLEFAGCVLAPSAEDLVLDPNGDFDSEGDLNFKEVSVPIKNQGYQNLYVLKHKVNSSRKSILAAFQKHGKTITPVVLPKLNNTVQILEQVRIPLKISPPRINLFAKA